MMNTNPTAAQTRADFMRGGLLCAMPMERRPFMAIA